MKTLIATEFHCSIYQGKYYLASQAYTIFKRYAEAFGALTLCARVSMIDNLPKDFSEATFVEKLQPIESLPKVLLGAYDKTIESLVCESDLVICRLPSAIGYRAGRACIKHKKKYMIENMCDGWSSYWYHGISGKIMAPYMHLMMKHISKHADYGVYVTEKYLQSKYPCKNQTIHASNVLLKSIDNNVLDARLSQIDKFDAANVKLLTTADVNTRTKGHEYVIEAIKLLREKGITATYYMIGGGDTAFLEKTAQKHGVEKQIVFLGRMSLDEIFSWIDKVDYYIQPSLQEGLPRSVIEAMSRACPCLGARTAGIPELLPKACVFDRKSAKAIADCILENSDHEKMRDYAKTNLKKAEQYQSCILDERRKSYFERIKQEIANH